MKLMYEVNFSAIFKENFLPFSEVNPQPDAATRCRFPHWCRDSFDATTQKRVEFISPVSSLDNH